MKYIVSQMAYFVSRQSNQRNIRFMLRFFLFLLTLIFIYTIIFHLIMAWEGREYSYLTGLYWTLTVMTTLGFGDITFTGDLGKLFCIVVLLSGVVLFMLIMPFTFIRYVYSPWLDAQTKARMPKKLPEDVDGHVIIAGSGAVAMSVVEKLRQYHLPYALLIDDPTQALGLYDAHYSVVQGDLDDPVCYHNMRVERAALVLAMHDDLKNTNIAATVREAAPGVPLAASIDNNDSRDILHLAGANHVFHFSEMLGKALARRVFNAAMQSNTIGRFEGLCIAEAPVQHTSLVGMTLLEADLRGRFNLNIAGIWRGDQYLSARPDSVFTENDVLLLAGTADSLEMYDKAMSPEWDEVQPPVLILGGGRVGKAVAGDLALRGIPFFLVEKTPSRVPKGDPRYVLGSAADHDVLRKAGIETTQTVVVTTHNDDLNIYLTIYCRKLRPDIQIISRATLDRNVASLYNAGANLVMSQSGITANTVVNLLIPGRVFMLTEGLSIFKIQAPPTLIGKTLLNSGIRNTTACNVMALRSAGVMHIPPSPSEPIQKGDELILVGSAQAEKLFMEKYM